MALFQRSLAAFIFCLRGSKLGLQQAIEKRLFVLVHFQRMSGFVLQTVYKARPDTIYLPGSMKVLVPLKVSVAARTERVTVLWVIPRAFVDSAFEVGALHAFEWITGLTTTLAGPIVPITD